MKNFFTIHYFVCATLAVSFILGEEVSNRSRCDGHRYGKSKPLTPVDMLVVTVALTLGLPMALPALAGAAYDMNFGECAMQK